MTDTKNFKREEFLCEHCKQEQMSQEFIDRLQRARSISPIPFKITSGWRCQHHNAEVGGRPNSSHVKGYAVDIRTRNDWERSEIVSALILAGFRRIGIAKNFIHVDSDPNKERAIWTY